MECKLCGRYIDEDDVQECPECLKEMCEECYENHASICFFVSEINYMDMYDE